MKTKRPEIEEYALAVEYDLPDEIVERNEELREKWRERRRNIDGAGSFIGPCSLSGIAVLSGAGITGARGSHDYEAIGLTAGVGTLALSVALGLHFLKRHYLNRI